MPAVSFGGVGEPSEASPPVVVDTTRHGPVIAYTPLTAEQKTTLQSLFSQATGGCYLPLPQQPSADNAAGWLQHLHSVSGIYVGHMRAVGYIRRQYEANSLAARGPLVYDPTAEAYRDTPWYVEPPQVI